MKVACILALLIGITAYSAAQETTPPKIPLSALDNYSVSVVEFPFDGVVVEQLQLKGAIKIQMEL